MGYHFLIKNEKSKQRGRESDKETSLKEGTFQGHVTSIMFSSEILEAVLMYQKEKDVEHPVFS